MKFKKILAAMKTWLIREKSAADFFKKFTILIITEVLLMLGAVLSVKAAMGMSPLSALVTVASGNFSVTYGQILLVWNIFWLIVLIIFNRKVLYIGTLVDAIFAGLIFDTISRVYDILLPNGVPEFMRFVLPVLGVLFIGFGLAMYIPLNFGVAIYDGIILTIQKVIKKSYTIAIWILAAVLIAAALLIGAQLIIHIGYGTIISSVLTGPVYDFLRRPVQIRLRKIIRMESYSGD